MKNKYLEYSKKIEEASNEVQLREVIKTARKGAPGLRDKLVFGKAAWQEALTYFAILQSIVIFMALIPTAFENLNAFFAYLNIPIVLPLGLSSVASVLFLAFIFCFGVLGYRYFGLPKRTQEIGAKMHPGEYLIWKEVIELKEEIRKLKEEK